MTFKAFPRRLAAIGAMHCPRQHQPKEDERRKRVQLSTSLLCLYREQKHTSLRGLCDQEMIRLKPQPTSASAHVDYSSKVAWGN